MLEVMAEQVDLADPGSQVLVQRAKTLPDGYVLKPQREGEGHVITGQALVDTLNSGGAAL